MSVSVAIFTPFHSVRFLSEAYRSIKSQPYDQWVIFPNHGPSVEDVPSQIRDDFRTKIVTNNDVPPSIGAIKKFVCSQCDTDVLVELDQDDLLVNDAIVKIIEAFKDPNVVFAYSDCAEFNDADKSIRMYGNATPETNYDSINGWVYTDYTYNDVLYKAAVSPPPIPYHASLILWAPNHFRAFRRDVYERVGGHDESLVICDDQDLMCRLYQEGDFYHINECCYLYRVHGANSWLIHNAAIQQKMVEIQKQYIRPMAESWAKRHGYTMIDLGGRFSCPEGYLSVDRKDANITCDLNERWPFEDSSVGIVRASDAIEHLDNIVFTMSEIHRVLMPGGYLLSDTPSTSGRGAWQDPTHKTFINMNSYFYYTRREQAQYIDNKDIRFKSIVLEEYFPNDWCRNNNIVYARADLICLKDGFRPMGTVDI